MSLRYEALPLLRRDKRINIVAVFSFKQEEAATLAEKAELQGVELYSGSQGLSSLLEREDIQAVVIDVHLQLMVRRVAAKRSSGCGQCGHLNCLLLVCALLCRCLFYRACSPRANTS